jgi:hypothetical protein
MQSGRENIAKSIVGMDSSVLIIGFAKRDVLQNIRKRSTKRNHIILFMRRKIKNKQSKYTLKKGFMVIILS